jgi:RHS repeat-associated protein
VDNANTVTAPKGTLHSTYNALNELATWGAKQYAYDNNGNTLSGDGTRSYKWDAENRLIEIDYVGRLAKSQFSYDGLGHRTVDVETAANGLTTTTRYLWCGARVCQTRDGNDNPLRRDLDEGEVNLLNDMQPLVYMPDQLGSVRDVLDGGTGALLDSFDYNPYGSVARSSGTTPMDYHYADLFQHPASGLNLSATRPLDGVTGRWLDKDPIREVGGTNLYAYVTANPLNMVDPMGLCDQPAKYASDSCNSPAYQQMLKKVEADNPGVTMWPCWADQTYYDPTVHGEHVTPNIPLDACELAAGKPCMLVPGRTPGPWWLKAGAYGVCEVVTTVGCYYAFPDKPDKVSAPQTPQTPLRQ